MAWTLARTWRLLRPEPLAQDLDEQLQSHFEMLIEENLERGMPLELARSFWREMESGCRW
ncbi:MAG TPA: hypothetical protein VM912_23345 [Terriglobales bacterium]|nr:hypothetical protein [Terriglobales bacterium]